MQTRSQLPYKHNRAFLPGYIELTLKSQKNVYKELDRIDAFSEIEARLQEIAVQAPRAPISVLQADAECRRFWPSDASVVESIALIVV